MLRTLSLWLSVTFVFIQAGSVLGQDSDIGIDGVSAADVATAIQAFSIFSISPGAQGGTYTLDSDDPLTGDADLKTAKVTLPCTFRSAKFCLGGGYENGRSADDAGPALCVAPYGEVTIAYSRASQVFDAGEVLKLDNRRKSIAGLAIPLTENASLRPMILAGFAHAKDETAIRGLAASFADELTRGVAFNFDTNAILYGAAVELRHRADDMSSL